MDIICTVRSRRNAFQQLMHNWAHLHPYNALAVVRIDGAADPDWLAASAAHVCGRLGLAAIWAGLNKGRLGSRSAPAVPGVRTVTASCGHADSAALAVHAADEMNGPFALHAAPMRLFVLPRGRYHYVGQVYQHWIGDAHFLDNVFCRILSAYLGSEPADGLPALTHGGPPLWRVALAAVGLHRWPGLGFGAVRELVRMRSCYRPADVARSDLRVAVCFPDLPPLPHLQGAARRRTVTINDLLLAALAEAVAVNTPERQAGSRRRDVALTSVIDLRPLDPASLTGAMGLYLSYFNVICRDADTRDFERTLASVHAQTARIKRSRSHVRGLLEIYLATLIWPRLRLEKRGSYFADRKPVAGGITNLKIPAAWSAGRLSERASRWWEVPPTGPMTPLALATRTYNGHLTCGVSFRPARYPPDRAQRIVEDFCGRLASL